MSRKINKRLTNKNIHTISINQGFGKDLFDLKKLILTK